MEEDRQEALSERFGGGMLMLLPLSSGHWALFDAARQLLAITPDLPSAETLRLQADVGRGVYEMERQATKVVAGKNVEDMGL